MEAKVRRLVAFTWFEGKKIKICKKKKKIRNFTNYVSCCGGIILIRFPAIQELVHNINCTPYQ